MTEDVNFLEMEALRTRLKEAEETLHAIHSGEVDALVVLGENGEQVFTLNGADYLYRVLIEDMSEGAVTMNSQGVILYANRCFAEFLCLPLEKVVGSVVATWLAPNSQPLLDVILKDSYQKHNGELALISSDGRQVPVYFSASRISKLPDYICLVTTDLTEIYASKQREAEGLTKQLMLANKLHRELQDAIEKQHETEKDLRFFQEQLEETVAQRTFDLVQARNAAQAANIAKSTFIASMSHELRTPLNAILGFSELMQRGDVSAEKQKEMLSIIHRSGGHLLSMINDVLDISKIETGQLELNIHDFDLITLLQEIGNLFGNYARNKFLNFTLDIAENVSQFVQADGGKLRKVLLNLLDNAVKFTKEGEIFLRAYFQFSQESVTELVIEVIDTGIGISDDNQNKLFKPFVQLEEKNSDAVGMGLGLLTSKSLVELMGGRLSVESVLGKGATFKIELPIILITNVHNNSGYEQHDWLKSHPNLSSTPLELTAEMLSSLPSELHQQLHNVALELDIDKLDKIIARLHLIAPDVAVGLEPLAQTYQFEQIIRLLES